MKKLKKVQSAEAKTHKNDNFDKRWDTKFGEPATEVFTPEEFKKWIEDVIRFE